MGRRTPRGGRGVRRERPGTAHRSAGGLHGHRRAGRDPPAQRPVRREEEPHPGAGDHRPGAARGHGQRLLPGGRQRRAVRRRVGVLPDGHQRRPDPVADRAGGQRRSPGAGRRRPHPAGRRRRPRPAEAHRCPAVRRRGPGARPLGRVAAGCRRRDQRRRSGHAARRAGRAPRPHRGAGPRRAVDGPDGGHAQGEGGLRRRQPVRRRPVGPDRQPRRRRSRSASATPW